VPVLAYNARLQLCLAGTMIHVNTTDNFVDEEFVDATPEYRVMLTDQGVYEVREVYFSTDGVVVGWVGGAVQLWSCDLDDLKLAFADIKKAFTRPFLEETQLPGYTPEIP